MMRNGRLLQSPSNPIDTAGALEHCAAITRARARNFYYGLKLSPEPYRSALFVIYAWMRAADDIVDGLLGEQSDATHAYLRDFRAATDSALAGHPENEPLWIGLAHMASQYRLPPEHFHGMLDGQLDDLSRGTHDSFDDLRNYCYRVASTVGLICIEIWGYNDASAKDLAIDRGIAFQLTNIIRDYKQDYDAGRVYLPVSDFQQRGIDPATLRHWSKPMACHAMMKQQISRAMSYYDRSAGLDDLITPCCRPTLWAMTTIYRGLLQKMDRNPSRIILTKRMRLSALHKGTIAVRAKWFARAMNSRGNIRTPVVSSTHGA